MAKTTTTQQKTSPTPRNAEVNHAIQHIEFVTTKPNELKTFFERQFGWKFETNKMPGGGGTGDYHSFRTPDGNGGGVLAPQMPNQPIACTPYINVEDCVTTEKSCKKNGATILMPTTEVPGMGKFFVFQVPGGPAVGCWQATASRN